jgi:hypothetical protein
MTSQERAEKIVEESRAELDSNYLYPEMMERITQAIDAAVDEAVAAEREACIADLNAVASWDRPTSVFRSVVIESIRARGAK